MHQTKCAPLGSLGLPEDRLLVDNFYDAVAACRAWGPTTRSPSRSLLQLNAAGPLPGSDWR